MSNRKVDLSNLKVDIRENTLKKWLHDASVSAEFSRVQKSAPLPDREAEQLAHAIALAGDKGILIKLKDVWGQTGGHLAAVLEVTVPKAHKEKKEAENYFINLMKEKGKWKRLGSSELSFATRRRIPEMASLPFATQDFLDLYGVQKNRLKYSVEIFLFGAIQKLTETEDGIDIAPEEGAERQLIREAQIKRIFKILEKSQPLAAKKEKKVDVRSLRVTIGDELQPLFDANDKVDNLVDGASVLKNFDKLIPEYEAAIEAFKTELLDDVKNGKTHWRKAISRAKALRLSFGAEGWNVAGSFRTATHNHISKKIEHLEIGLEETKTGIQKSVRNRRGNTRTRQRRVQAILKAKMPKVLIEGVKGFGDVDGKVKSVVKFTSNAAARVARIGLLLDVVEIITASTVRKAVVKVVEVGLSAGGTLAGMKAGAAIGAFGGPVGVFIGGLVGGVLGSILGEAFAEDLVAIGEKFVDTLAEHFDDFAKSVRHEYYDTVNPLYDGPPGILSSPN